MTVYNSKILDFANGAAPVNGTQASTPNGEYLKIKDAIAARNAEVEKIKREMPHGFAKAALLQAYMRRFAEDQKKMKQIESRALPPVPREYDYDI